MSTMSTMQVATNEADLFGDQFDVDKFLMTNEWNNTSDLHQQSSSPPEDNMLTGLLLSDTVRYTVIYLTGLSHDISIILLSVE